MEYIPPPVGLRRLLLDVCDLAVISITEGWVGEDGDESPGMNKRLPGIERRLPFEGVFRSFLYE